ncbi:MAG: hypothetical protein PWQ77_1586 [Kosmotogales bacterium]|nr:hypothetical protein [Kosmotogales bacterium]
MIDLSKKVYLKGKRTDYEKYCEIIRREYFDTFEHYQKNPDRKIIPGLTKKVNEDGKYRGFYGDTTVFQLDGEAITRIKTAQDFVHERIPGLLARRLDPNFFHITLHDLNNENDDFSSMFGLRERVKETSKKAGKIFREINEYITDNPEDRFAKVESIGIASGGFVALMMVFLPSTEKDYRIIMNLYNLFDEIVYLKNFLRIHLTLNYFNTEKFGPDEIRKTMEVTKNFKKTFRLKLDLQRLAYQTFTDMNSYETIFSVKDFCLPKKRE